MEKLQVILRQAVEFAVEAITFPAKVVGIACGLVILRWFYGGVMFGSSLQDAIDEE